MLVLSPPIQFYVVQLISVIGITCYYGYKKAVQALLKNINKAQIDNGFKLYEATQDYYRIERLSKNTR